MQAALTRSRRARRDVAGTPADPSDDELVLALTYDDQSRVATLTDRAGRVLHPSYDPAIGVRIGYDLETADGRTSVRTDVFRPDHEAVKAVVLACNDDLAGRGETAILGTVQRQVVIPADGSAANAVYRLRDRRGRLVGFALDADIGDGVAPEVVTMRYDRTDQVLRRDELVYAYDSEGRLDTLTAPGGVADLTYDSAGYVSSLRLPNGVLRTVTGRDAQGRVTGFTQDVVSGAIDEWVSESFAIERDSQARVERIVDPEGETRYEYADGYLIAETRVGEHPRRRRYSHDGNANRRLVIDFSDPLPGSVDLSTASGTLSGPVVLDDGVVLAGDQFSAPVSVEGAVDRMLADRLAVEVVMADPSGSDVHSSGWHIGHGASANGTWVLWQVRVSQSSALDALPFQRRVVIDDDGDFSNGFLYAGTWQDEAGGSALGLELELRPADELVITPSVDGIDQAELRVERVGLGWHFDDDAASLYADASSTLVSLEWEHAQGRASRTEVSNARNQVTDITIAKISRQEPSPGTGDWSDVVLEDRSQALSYDAAGNLETIAETDHLNGDTVTSVATYQYDEFDRLIDATRQVNGTSVGSTMSYVGDGFHRHTLTSGGSTTQFVWDGTDILRTIDQGTGNVDSHVSHGGTAWWRHRADSGGTGIDTAVTALGALGNVRGEIGQLHWTDGSGNLQPLGTGYRHRFHYDAWGQRETLVAHADGGTVAYLDPGAIAERPGPGYRGLWTDPTGLVHMRHRFYDPALGRFLTEDPARAGNNWYAYAGGDPVNRWDPSGLDDIRYKEGTENDPNPVVQLMPENWRGVDDPSRAVDLGVQVGDSVIFAPWTGLRPMPADQVIGIENNSGVDLLENLAEEQDIDFYFDGVVRSFAAAKFDDFAGLDQRFGFPLRRSDEWLSGRDLWKSGGFINLEDSLDLEGAADAYYQYLQDQVGKPPTWANLLRDGDVNPAARQARINMSWAATTATDLRNEVLLEVGTAGLGALGQIRNIRYVGIARKTDDAAELAAGGANFFDDAGKMVRRGSRPVYRQGCGTVTCGPTSVGMILDTLRAGRASTQTAHSVKSFGTYITELADTLRANGLNAVTRTRQSIDDLVNLTRSGSPAIAHLRTNGGHFVVVDGVTVRAGRAVVAIRDPAGGQYFQLVDDFLEAFSGGVVGIE